MQHRPRRRAFAAAVTPLSADATAVDLAAIDELVTFYVASGLDGLLILGTTGEGVLLSVEERRAVAQRYIAASAGRIAVIVHCGAQSTRDTVELACHAAQLGAAGVAVIAPPYFALDDVALEHHFVAAADACDPTPFYIYEFAARSGYAVPLGVVESVREHCLNLAGLKVSDSPFEKVEPYLIPGLEVYIGAEALIHDGLTHGAAGAVSGLAAALPELTIRAVRSGSAEDSAAAARVRVAIQRSPFHAALKRVLRARGVRVESAVRAPLRDLDTDEAQELAALFVTELTPALIRESPFRG
ncbi:MAG: dihydrodipicolinate synthase family protein [Candidatus Dormibacteraeota bacterium]|nr:dihydrodipicolinate synthase family protein [Candidatus Dormibacteraeota bacterium]